MKLKTNFLGVCSIALLLMMSSCGALVRSVAVSKITVENGAIPPEFGKENTTLICVITGRKSFDRYMLKHVRKQYHGKYEFVRREDLNSDEFKNTSKYRYIFDVNMHNYSGTSYNPSSGSFENNTIRTSSCHIIDRKEHITYNSPMSSSFFSKLIQAYMINLEKERLKHQ